MNAIAKHVFGVCEAFVFSITVGGCVDRILADELRWDDCILR
jgi:hypothetical protein